MSEMAQGRKTRIRLHCRMETAVTAVMAKAAMATAVTVHLQAIRLVPQLYQAQGPTDSPQETSRRRARIRGLIPDRRTPAARHREAVGAALEAPAAVPAAMEIPLMIPAIMATVPAVTETMTAEMMTTTVTMMATETAVTTSENIFSGYPDF